MSNAKALTDERKNVHGDWNAQAMTASNIKLIMHGSPKWASISPQRREALDMIAVKLSRIIEGDANHEDHWDDIGGYAYLGKAGHS